MFLYQRLSKKYFPCYKSNYDVSSNDRGVIYSPKRRCIIEDDPIVGIIGTIPPIKNKRPPTAVSTQGNDVSNVIPSLSQIKDSRLIFCIGIWCSYHEGQFQVKVTSKMKTINSD